MNIIELRNKFVTNCEVLGHLKDVKVGGKKRSQEYGMKDVMSYLEKTPAGHQSGDQLAKVIERLGQFELEVIEKFQIVNLVPKNQVNLFSIIEDCDIRFDAGQIESILGILKEEFPKEFEQEEA